MMSKIREHLKTPTVIQATYRIVTPMFIGDAEQNATGISPQSIKGALRFWWRALMWGKIYSETKNENAALKELHQLEGKLFGQASDNANAAAITLRVDDSAIKYQGRSDWPLGGNDSSGYLGLGLWESGSHDKGNFQPHREYISENQIFSVILNIRPSINADQQQTLKDALLAWGLFGGLGSRARRAFGSVAIQSIDNATLTFSKTTDYLAAVNQLLAIYRLKCSGQAPFTAFDTTSRFAIHESLANNARQAHSTLGGLFKQYRGTKDSPVRGVKKRVFGIPFAGGATDLEKNKARRASPLLFHIHPIGSQFVASSLFMPTQFHYEPSIATVDYSIAENFLKQFKGGLSA